MDGVIHHVIKPGGALLHAHHGCGRGVDGLIFQGGAGVQSQIADEIRIAAQKAAVDILIIEVHLGGAVLLSVNGHGGGGAVDNAGFPNQRHHGQHHKYHGNQTVQEIAALFRLLLFNLHGGLGRFGNGVLSRFLFVRCAHFCCSSSQIQWFFRCGRAERRRCIPIYYTGLDGDMQEPDYVRVRQGMTRLLKV